MKGYVVRLVRFLGLAAALVAVYVAGNIFQHHNLRDFFPGFILDAAPALYGLARWLPEDLLTLAWWLSVLAAIIFGLVAPSWPLRPHPVRRRTDAARPVKRTRTHIARWFLLVALLAAVANLVYLAATGNEQFAVRLVWVGGLFLWLWGCAWLNPPPRQRNPTNDGEPVIRRSLLRHGGLLFFILVCAGLLFGWQLAEAPAAMTDDAAYYGLQALAASRGDETHFFVTSRSEISPLAVMPAALAIRLLGDPLLGLRVAGLFAGLLTVLATWLAGSELFRRVAATGPYGEPVLDSGEWVALLAAGLVAANTIMIHFSHLPFFLEPVAWGCLGLWAWLRGLRTGNLLTLGLSGVLCGWAALIYQSGMLFGLVIPLWWLGVWLLQPSWLHHPHTTGRTLGIVWLGGLLVALAPLIGIWLRTPGLWIDRWQGSVLGNLPGLVTIFNLDPDPGAFAGYPGDGVGALLAPLLILAAGALLLNLDHLVGWCLLTWCTGALLLGGLLSTQAPFWPVLLPLLPGLALVLAFTLDRIRATLLESVGTWAAQATTYLAVSLVIWAGLAGWTGYFDFVTDSSDPASYTGQVVRTLPSQQSIVLVLGQQREHINPDTPILRLANAGRATTLTAITVGEWPATLAPGAILLLQPEERTLLPELAQRYPGGALTIIRDRRANPVAYLYQGS